MTAPDAYAPGPCETWPVKWRCSLSGEDPAVTGVALQAASEVLYQLSGQRFSSCEVTIRPCREECYSTGWGGWAGWWQYGTYPQPAFINGTWYNLTCGTCGSGCSCTPLSEVFLPGPVQSVTEVKVDGVVLVSGVDYRVDDYRKLVRLGGAVWPYCNELNLADTEVGTWSVTVVYGESVPVLGQIAVGEIACSFLDYLNGGECDLPAGLTDISRQGVSMTFANATVDLVAFFARFPMSYLFIKTFNPNGLMARARAYDLDGPDFRVVGTA